MELSQDHGHRVAEDLKGRGKVKVRFTVGLESVGVGGKARFR